MAFLKRGAAIAFASCALLAMAAQARAAVIIDFRDDGAGPGGTISTSGGNVVGTGIPLGNVRLIPNSGAPGIFTDFDTLGTGVGPGGNGSAVLNFNKNAGTFSIVGGVVGAPGTNAASVLVSGALGTITFNPFNSQFSAQIGGLNTVNTALMTGLGLSGPPDGWSLSGFSIATQLDGTTFVPFSTDISDTGSSAVGITAVPEPGSLMLMGSGLLMLSVTLRRFRRS